MQKSNIAIMEDCPLGEAKRKCANASSAATIIIIIGVSDRHDGEGYHLSKMIRINA